MPWLFMSCKRNQINLDNIIAIGVNCGGSVSPVAARKMIKEKFEVDPDKVTKEEIDRVSSSSSSRAAIRVSRSTILKRKGTDAAPTAAGAR